MAKELNLCGQFEWENPSMTDADLITELSGGRWMPGTDDFVAVPGGTVPVTPTFGHMLGAIMKQPVKGVSRVNLFTHANPDLIGFGGHIEKRTVGPADVFILVNQGPGDNLTAMDPTSMINLSLPGTFFTMPGIARIEVADIRKRFADDAMLVLYACHSGQKQSFVKSIATFFNIKVVGFNDLIGYYPPAQTQAGKFLRTGMKIGIGRNGTPVTDWRNLISDKAAIVTTP